MKNITRLADAPMPTGWTWHVIPGASNTGGVIKAGLQNYTRHATYVEYMERLRVWIDNYDLGLEGHGQMAVEDPDTGALANVWTSFVVKKTTHDKTIKRLFSEITCTFCGSACPPHSIICRGCLSYTQCLTCRVSGMQLYRDGAAGSNFCVACSNECRECSKPCDPNFAKCNSCAPRMNCNGCRQMFDDFHITTVQVANRDANNNPVGRAMTRHYCTTCMEQVCGNCNRFVRADGLRTTPERERQVCTNCYTAYFDEYRNAREEFDAEELTSDALVIPAMDGRQFVRDVGIEIEGGGDGQGLARHLYSKRMVPIAEIARYHAGTDGFPAVITSDASVDWEMVFDRFNPSNPAAVKKVHDVLRATREKLKDGSCHLDLRCGCHIHVDAHKVGMKDAFNLWALWNYIEDPVFRFSSANWDVHRAYRFGRDNGAAQPVPKGPYKGRVEFGMAMNNSIAVDRYYALSFQNFWNAIHRGCSCGAIRYEAWNECTCNLGKCTFEFRVFNSTLNPRKLHAYVAFAQALVAKAIELPEVNIDEYAPLEWNNEPVKVMKPAAVDAIVPEWEQRLTWIFNELPLTDDERDSLRYCVENSDLKIVGSEFIRNLGQREQRHFQEVAA